MASSHEAMKLCLSRPELHISSSADVQLGVLQALQQLYCDTRQNEKPFALCKPKTALQQLYCNGLNSDQVYEQIILNDSEEISMDENVSGVTRNNLYLRTEEVCTQLESKPAGLQLLKDLPLSQFLQHTSSSTSSEDDASEKDEDDMDASHESELEDDESELEEGGELEEGELEEDEEGELEEEADEGGELEEDEEGELEEEADEEGELEEEDESEIEIKQASKIPNGDLIEDSEDDTDHEEDEMEDDSNDESNEDNYLSMKDEDLFKKYASDAESASSFSGEEDLTIGSDEDSDDDLKQALEKYTTNNTQHQEDEEDDEEELEINPPKKKKGNKESEISLNRDDPLNNINIPTFSKTSVDSPFFSVRESEWVADADIIGGKAFNDIDFMAASDEEDESKATNIKYKDFFDTPSDTSKKVRKRNKNKTAKKEETDEDNENEEEAEEESNGGDDESEEEGEKQQPSAEEVLSTEQVKSHFESGLESELALRKRLEESNISEKPWILKGEVQKADRPDNSVLTEYLEYRSGLRHKPTVDDVLTRRIERLVIQRYRTKTFDSVERKAAIVENAFEYKKKLVLDQEKSTKSLSKIYEDEYLANTRLEKAREAGEELPLHKSIREKYEELEGMLNALSNAHYTPNMSRAELKVVSNLPAMRVEEATPLVMTDSGALAPQEVLAPDRGDFKAASEKTDTDRKHDRRVKKHRQHLKYVEENRRTEANVKKAEKEGRKLDVDTTTKVVKKAIKVGHVFRMDNEAESIKSSTSFFRQLQAAHDASTNAIGKKRKFQDDRKKYNK